MIGAFVRGLSMREVESLFEQAGPGKLSKSTASRMCEDLEERLDAFKRRDLYDVRLALFRGATFIAVHLGFAQGVVHAERSAVLGLMPAAQLAPLRAVSVASH